MGLEARLVTNATGDPAIFVNAQLHLRLGLLLLAAGLALTLAAARAAAAFAFAFTTFALLVFFCEPDLIVVFLLGHPQLLELIGLGIVRRVIRPLVLFVLRIREDLRLAPVAIRRDQHHVLAFLVARLFARATTMVRGVQPGRQDVLALAILAEVHPQLLLAAARFDFLHRSDAH